MPNEMDIARFEQILTDITRLGGDKERTSIVPNLVVVDPAPSGQAGFITIVDERDGNTILAKKVTGVIYAAADKVNVLFVEGTEPIAFQQGSESPSSGLWGIVPSTSTDIFYNGGDVGIGKSVAPDAALEILDTAQAQLRLTHTEDTKFVDFTLDTNHDLTIDPSSTGQIKLAATVTVIDEIQHEGDPDTKIGFTDDTQTFTVGGLVALQITEAAQDLVEIGDVAGTGDWDVDFNNGQMLLTGSSGVLTLDSNEVPVIVDSVTKTVQAAGGDFTTIQGAVDFFKNKLIVGSCLITVEAATYAESVSVVDLFIGATGSLEIRGDTRVLAGQSYVDGAETNTSSKANGGTGVFTLANAGNDITVTGATTNPDFDADGWGSGDKILTYDNAGAVAEHTISSTLNNVITLTGAAPALGNDATAIMLQPDRKITGATSLTVDVAKGIQATGLYFAGSGGGVSVENGGYCIIRNCAARPASGNGFVASGFYSSADCSGGAVSAWDSGQGFRANNSSSVIATNSVCVGSTTGYRGQLFSFANLANAVSVNCTTAFDALIFTEMDTFQTYARQNTTGYKAQSFSFIRALSTNAKNNGNGTDYNPAASGVHGNNGSMIQWT